MKRSCRQIVLFSLFVLSALAAAYDVPLITADMKAVMRDIWKRGDAMGRIEGKMGQWGNSITNSQAYLGSLASGGCSGNATCESYHDILLWMKASETSPGSGIVGGYHATPLDEKGGGHCCESGWKVTDGLWCIGGAIQRDNPSWSLTEYGTNDLTRSWTADDYAAFKQRMKYLLVASIEAGIIPAAGAIPPRMENCSPANNDSVIVKRLNDSLKAAAQELHVPYVDYYQACVEHHPTDWCGGAAGTISDDGIHPSWHSNTNNFAPPAIYNDGYAIRSKQTLDYARKLKTIVFDNGAPDGQDLPILAVSSSTHPWGEYNNSATASFSWVHDGGPAATEYSYVFNQTASTIPDETSEGTGTTATVNAGSTGEWFFHVRANSATGWGPAAHYPVRIIGENQAVVQDGMNGYSGATDAMIFDQYNYGASAIQLKYNGGESRDRLLVKFDLSSFAGATITDARFELFIEKTGGDDSLSAHALTNSWQEGTGGYEKKTGVSWTYRYANDSAAWTTPGGDFASQAIDGKKINAADAFTWKSFNMTIAAQQWCSDPSNNHGLILIGHGSYSSTYVYFREFPLKTLRPRLVLTGSGFSHTETIYGPRGSRLGAPYPNPGNPGVFIPVHVAPRSRVTVKIYSIKGTLVYQTALVNGTASPNIQTVSFGGNGKSIASGIYLARLQGEKSVSSAGKLILMQ